MIQQERLVTLLSDFARHIVGQYEVEDILEQLSHGVTQVLSVTGAGIMLDDDQGVLRFVAASNDLVREIERLQIELGEGPCLHAARTGEQVVVDDLNASPWFPAFAPRALQLGMVAVYSFPMRVENSCIGAMNLYCDRPGQWTDEASVAGQLLADVATGYILNARVYAHQSKLTGQLQHALSSRILIEQAKGKVSALADVSVDRAFDVLRRYARSRGIRLHDVAAKVVEGAVPVEDLCDG